MSKFKQLGILVAAACVALSTVAAGARARHADAIPETVNEPQGSVINILSGSPPSQLIVPLNKSQVVRFDRPFREINVGAKDVAGVVPLSRMTAAIIGKKSGTTNLTLIDGSGHVIAVIEVVVGYDVPGLQQRIHDLMPNENIDISIAGDALVLSGHVSSSDHLRQIQVLAEGYAAKDKVKNLLAIGASQQVLLEVRFTEISRNALKDLGVNTNMVAKIGSNLLDTTTGAGVPPTAFGVFSGLFTGHNFELDVTIDALEKKGLLRTLAEPNLVALSGQTASFLAGGEFPVPVAQSVSQGTTGNVLIGAFTVEFKDFGVGLGFTPTVIGKDLINLDLNSEVSALDPTLSVEQNGINIPGLKVRRAKTTIELHDGESFAIAGLMQDDFQDAVSQVPGLGNLPVIGALFRSTNFQHNQTELAIFITVHLVEPKTKKELASPTDTTQPPAPLGLFGNGETQTLVPPKPQSNLPHGDVLP